ncbi:hypothetical protein NPX13_g7759 [Xylaria arbuscula]|uniref:Ankyrin n=1 Tax=Xylaria arbuscula TaxID=114810 RepID=A0A9W8TKH0_9PEZI|nr:hypothetical protein NPX13_g7759 [Xylaria arbuscula]
MDCCFSDAVWLQGNYAMYQAIISQNEYTRTNITIAGSIIAALEGTEQLQLYLHSRPNTCITDRRLLLETAFSLAAGNGHAAAVRSLSEIGVDPNTRVLLSKAKGWEVDWHPLMRAASAKDLTIVRMLVEMGSGLGLATELLNPLAAAVWTPEQLTQKKRASRLEIMNYLLRRGVPPQKRTEAMIKAVIPPHTPDGEVIDTLLTAGQVINEIIEDGKSILHFAIDKNCSLGTVEILVSRGAQIHSRPCIQDGRTMVHSAAASCSKDRRKIIEFLLGSGADCGTEHGGSTVLESVLSVDEWRQDEPDNLQVVSMLLSRGARINGPEVRLPNTSSRRTPLVVGLLRNNAPDALIIQTIEAGADISLPDTEHDDGDTPLVTAIGRGRLDIARQLIYRGADVNAISPRSNQGALHAACDPSHADVSLGFIQYLLDNDADINATNRQGLTALECAIIRGSMGAFCLLLDAGAAISGPTDIYKIISDNALATAAY